MLCKCDLEIFFKWFFLDFIFKFEFWYGFDDMIDVRKIKRCDDLKK